VIITVHVYSKGLPQQRVFSSFMSIELTAKTLESDFQLDPFLNRLIRVESLGDEPVHACQQLRMLGLNTPAFRGQGWAQGYRLVQTAATFLLGEMMLQLVTNLTKDFSDVGTGSISIRSMRPHNCVMSHMEHSMQPTVLRD
jgi:hypothetical protein